MPRYIDADKVLQYPLRRDRCDKEHANPHFINGVESVMEYIECLLEEEPVDVQEVKHGKMKLFGPRCRKHNAVYTCSICSALVSSYYNDIGEWKYCLHCGAKLEKEGKNNDTY